jgi:Uma2 family endonuclease
MGTREALLASVLAHFLWTFVEEHDLGLVLGGDGFLRLMPGLVRIPDVSFLSWSQLPEGKLPDVAIAPLAPYLAVEVLSPSNTRGEIKRKLKDYFLAGTQLAWIIQPKTQTADVYTSPDDKKRLGKAGVLDGGSVLPGFRLALPELFARTEQRSKRRKTS